MFDLIQASVNVCENCRAKEAIDGVSAGFKQGGAFGVMFGLAWEAMPVIAVAKDDGICLRKQEVGNGGIAQRRLFLVLPASRRNGGLGNSFDIGALVRLVRELPNRFARIRAGHSHRFAGVRSYLFATDPARVVWHIMRPIGCIVALPLIVSATARTKAHFAAWLFNRELLATSWASADGLTGASTGGAYLLPLLYRKATPAQ